MAKLDKLNPVSKIEDYGLNNNLENISISIHKILKQNSNLIEENKQLKDKIRELELNTNTLITNNKNLVDMFRKFEIEQKQLKDIKVKEVQLDLLGSKEQRAEIDISETSGRNIRSKEKENMNYYKQKLLETDKNDFNSKGTFINRILNLEDTNIEDDFAEYIISLVQDIIEKNQVSDLEVEILDLIELLYKKLDEDLLIEFTELNHLYILQAIKDTQIKPTNLIIDMVRILYFQEKLIVSDDYLSLLNFKSIESYIKDEDKIVELILIYNHILGCKDREDIKHLWPGIWKEGFIECNDVLDYLKAHEYADKGKTNRSYNSIRRLNSRLNDIDKIDREVNGDLRKVAYYFMIKELEKRVKLKDIKTKDNIKRNTKPIDSNIEELYFDHKLYMVKNDRQRCPFDLNELVGKNIVEKTYDKLGNLKLEENPIYQKLDLFYCIKCKNYFIKENYRNKIENHIKVIPIRKTVIPSEGLPWEKEVEFNLNEESPLKARGYHTGLSDNKRWNILSNKCIPELGMNKVLFYLEGFISRFSAQKKDYSNSIGIWKQDIKKIKRVYR